ncbi:MAG: CHAT domain-containing protein [Spirochaetia bacterium]|nr:CHAT domain-containing protein [Spirochaetia bacterium]
METIPLLNIIIDRVGNINVFNILQGNFPGHDTHLQSEIDDDMIAEFLSEIERFSIISNNVSEKSRKNVNVIENLRSVSETFFCQFFPSSLQKKLRNSSRAYIFFHVDRKLRNIPWELLHDGTGFLSDKFFIGKNISGNWHEFIKPEKDKLRLLIVADPSEDLEWARLEGEKIFESLNSEVSSDRLDIQLMSGKRITKLNLLNALKDRDIVHYAGHMIHDEDPRESGWLLSEGKVLRAREIEKAGLEPDLVFSNSCFSSPVGGNAPDQKTNLQLNDMASAFLSAGISNYVGSNWKIKDDGRAYTFAHDFYRAIFEEKTVGEALFYARMKARERNHPSDLTWGNYVLHGNPIARIYRNDIRKYFDASRSSLNVQRIIETYPVPVAREYRHFMNVSENTLSSFKSLSRLLKYTMQIVGAVVFSNCRHLGLREFLPVPGAPVLFSRWILDVFECLEQVKSHQMQFSMEGLMEGLYMHKSDIEKMLLWRNDFINGRIKEDLLDSYRVTFQYLLDNMLSTFSFLGKNNILFIDPEKNISYSFSGQEVEEHFAIPPGIKNKKFADLIEANRGHLCLQNREKQILIPVDDYMSFDPETKNMVLFNLEDDLEVPDDLKTHFN